MKIRPLAAIVPFALVGALIGVAIIELLTLSVKVYERVEDRRKIWRSGKEWE